MPDKSFLSYIGVAGGIICKEVLGSRSTHLRGGFGCIGRNLLVDDVLVTGDYEVESIWRRVRFLRPAHIHYYETQIYCLEKNI